MNKLYTTLIAGSLLVGMAVAGNAATFSYNFLETDGIPLSYSYSQVSGNTYALTGSTSNIAILFAGPATYENGITELTPYSATLTISAVETLGDGGTPNSQEKLDSLTATFSNINGVAGNFFTVTAGTGTAGQAGVLSAQAGTSSGGFAGSTTVAPPGTAPDNVMFASNVVDTSDFSFDSYSFTITLAPGDVFTYTPRPAPSTVDDLDPFTASLTGGGSSTIPTPPTTPEPGSIGLAVGALVSFSMLRLRRRK
jgi:hypothetical protein